MHVVGLVVDFFHHVQTSQECEPDGISDDPHFNVHLPSGHLLCFDVKGESGKYFSLISTNEFEMNAQFVKLPSSRHPKNTWLGAIGVATTGRTIVFNSTNGAVSVDNKFIDPSSIQTITIDGRRLFFEGMDEEKSAHRVEVIVRDLEFRFTVIFKTSKSDNPHLNMLWHNGMIHEDCIHGLLGELACTSTSSSGFLSFL